jgi:hypothetical protein
MVLVHISRKSAPAASTRWACCARSSPGPFPVAAALQRLNFLEVDADEAELCRMEPAKPFFDALINGAVIARGGFPAHAAEKADGFHC